MKLLELLFRRNKKETKQVNMVTASFTFDDVIDYKSVRGFFLYDGDIFFRSSKGGGKRVRDDVSFSSIATKGTPMSSKEIGKIEVLPLKFSSMSV